MPKPLVLLKGLIKVKELWQDQLREKRGGKETRLLVLEMGILYSAGNSVNLYKHFKTLFDNIY